jgi:hypothetical protein
MRSIGIIVAIILIHSGNLAWASDDPSSNEGSTRIEDQVWKVERVGGTYKVDRIKRTEEGYFRITFSATTPSGRFDELILETDHLNFLIKEGNDLRISAEVVSDSGRSAQVSQVVVFAPNLQGNMPIWLLSRKFPPRDLTGASYIEMHAPQTDYMLF